MAPLVREFEFLQRQGRVPAGVEVARVAEAFSYGGLRQVQADPRGHRVFTYDYEP